MPEFSGKDYDGDGVPADEDCDDQTPHSLTMDEDGDCDGVLTNDDGDDTDPTRSEWLP